MKYSINDLTPAERAIYRRENSARVFSAQQSKDFIADLIELRTPEQKAQADAVARSALAHRESTLFITVIGDADRLADDLAEAADEKRHAKTITEIAEANAKINALTSRCSAVASVIASELRFVIFERNRLGMSAHPLLMAIDAIKRDIF